MNPRLEESIVESDKSSGAGGNFATRSLLQREDSDTIQLIDEEHALATKDISQTFTTRSATASSGQTLQTSISSTISMDNIPYIDSSSSQDSP